MPHARSLFLTASVALGLGVVAPGPLRAEDAPSAPMSDTERDAALKRAEQLDREVEKLYGDRKYGDAVSLARESLAIRENALGRDHPLVATSLNYLALLLKSRRSYAEARPLYERALAINEQTLGKDHPDVATILNNLAQLLSAQRSYAQARPLHERALAIREKALGKDHADVAQSLNNLALLLESQGSDVEARPLYERALAINEKALGEDHPLVATSLSNLATLLQRQRAFAEARPLFERALAINEKALGKDHPDVAWSLNDLAALLSDQGAHAEARPLFERAIAIRERALGFDHPDVAQSLSDLAGLLDAQCSDAEARPLYERALAIREKTLGKDHPLVATSLNNLALLLKTRGSYAEARPLYERALAIREDLLGKDHPAVAQSLNNLALLLDDQGSFAEALPLYQRALKINEAALGNDHPEVATSINNLALRLAAHGSHAEARPLYERALAIREKVLGRDHPHVAVTLNNLALLLESQNRYVEARPLHERALVIAERALGPGHRTVALYLNNLASLLYAQGSYTEARPLFERALAIREGALSKSHPDVATSLNNLAALLQDQGAYAEARPLYERALVITESSARAQISALTASQRLALLRSTRGRLDTWLDFAPRVGLTGYPEALRLRGLVARAEASERVMSRRATGDDRRVLDALQAAQRLASGLANDVPASKDAAVLAAWQQRYATAAAERERLTLEFTSRVAPARTALERLDLGLPDVQRSLAPDTALVDVLRVGNRYVAWVVRASGDPIRLDVGAADAIEAACVAFASAIADGAGVASIHTAGEALQGRVWTPVVAKLGADVRRVVVCPDAALASVPFAALPGKAPDTALVDDLPISYVFHPFDLVARKGAPPSGQGALVVGGVDYEKADAGSTASPLPARPPVVTSLDRAPDGGAFGPIPATRVEAVALRDQFGKDATTLLAGPNATEARFREAVKGRRIVHVATHGFARTDLLAGLYDRKVKDAFLSADVERQLAVGHDPMLLCGLAFAGANPRDGADGDDGVLTALEASYLDLDGADLVALSACNTARGTAASGEGVLGLVSAFQMAGARRVLASLWKVDDEPTRFLMERFYASWSPKEGPGLSASDALRKAQQEVRSHELVVEDPSSAATGQVRRVPVRPWAHPKYWAAFVAYGG